MGCFPTRTGWLLTAFFSVVVSSIPPLCAALNIYDYRFHTMPETSYYGGIHSIAKDSIGRIWFSGYDALFMYNGSAFVRMDDLVTGLSPSSYWNYGQVVTDRRGGLYVGTNHGLLRFDYGSRSFESVLDGNIGSVMVNGDGTVWLIRNNDIESFDRSVCPRWCVTSGLGLLGFVFGADMHPRIRLCRDEGKPLPAQPRDRTVHVFHDRGRRRLRDPRCRGVRRVGLCPYAHGRPV